jgi:hypothetical protein
MFKNSHQMFLWPYKEIRMHENNNIPLLNSVLLNDDHMDEPGCTSAEMCITQ